MWAFDGSVVVVFLDAAAGAAAADVVAEPSTIITSFPFVINASSCHVERRARAYTLVYVCIYAHSLPLCECVW